MGLLSRWARQGIPTHMAASQVERQAFNVPWANRAMHEAMQGSRLFQNAQSGHYLTIKEREVLEAVSRGASDEDALRMVYGADPPEPRIIQILLSKANRKMGAPADYRWEDGLLPPGTF